MGIILLFILILQLGKFDLRKFSKSPEDLANPEQMKYAMEELFQLVNAKEDSLFILKGLVLHHCSQCQKSDCPFITFEKKTSLKETKAEDDLSYKKKTNRLNSDLNLALLNYINFEFKLCTQKFPDDIWLSLSYSIFLQDGLKNPSTALAELSKCEIKNPSFVQDFLIFRYKQLIKEDLLSQGIHENNSLASYIEYEGLFAEFKRKIEKSANYHMNFWSLLMEESPNMQKMLKIGFGIISNLELIETLWNRIQEINANNQRALKVYAEFTLNVLNDRETSQVFLNKARDHSFTKSNFGKNKAYFRGETNSKIPNVNGAPCLVINGQQQQIGLITECNLSLCREFGYPKDELIGKNVKKLMPEQFAFYHDEILLRNLESKENLEDHEINTFGLHRNGYIFPLSIRIIEMPSFLNDTSYIALFHIEKSLTSASIAHILIDKNKNITYISSSSIILLGLQKLSSVFDSVPVSTFLPDLFGPLAKNYLSKAGAEIEFTFPNFNAELQHVKEKFNCNLQAIQIKEYGIIGYSIKLIALDNDCEEIIPFKEEGYSLFQFSYSEELNKYVREIREDNTKKY